MTALPQIINDFVRLDIRQRSTVLLCEQHDSFWLAARRDDDALHEDKVVVFIFDSTCGTVRSYRANTLAKFVQQGRFCDQPLFEAYQQVLVRLSEVGHQAKGRPS